MWKCYLNDKTLHVAASIKALSSLSELPSTGHTHARTHTTLLKPFKSQYIENVFTEMLVQISKYFNKIKRVLLLKRPKI